MQNACHTAAKILAAKNRRVLSGRLLYNRQVKGSADSLY
jgi:hypothetical protein